MGILLLWPELLFVILCFAGVVVIDDQPEVSIDDPAFLFESNEGFQEVTSRKTQKSKQKAAQEEANKKIQEQQMQQAAAAAAAAVQAKKGEKDSKVLFWLSVWRPYAKFVINI